MKNITPNIYKQKEFMKETLKTTIVAGAFSKTTIVVGAFLLLLGAVLWPLATIWALNGLFDLSIQYTFKNWLACVVLIFTLQGALRVSRKTISTTND